MVLDRAGGLCQGGAVIANVDRRQGRACTRWATDVHELLRRSQGGDPTDPSGCVALCRACHRWVTENPRKAHQVGLVYWSWERTVGPAW